MNTSLIQRPPLTTSLELCALSRSIRSSADCSSRRANSRRSTTSSLRLYRGETLGLVGESGCGKSTLAKMLLAGADLGNVLINGQEVDPTERRACARIQPIFQDRIPRSIRARPSARSSACRQAAWHRHAAERARQVRQILDLVGMPDAPTRSIPTSSPAASASGGDCASH
jgi:peptide/nickel transport system ATP-binding protein